MRKIKKQPVILGLAFSVTSCARLYRRTRLFTLAVLGDTVNRTARYCAAAKSEEVLISPELYTGVWRITRDAESITVDAKFEEHLPAYHVRSLWEQQRS